MMHTHDVVNKVEKYVNCPKVTAWEDMQQVGLIL